jgi:hypothetical protein
MDKTLFNKISSYNEYIYWGYSVLDSFDILVEFRELYESLRDNDISKAYKIAKSLYSKNKLNNFIEYVKIKSCQTNNNTIRSEQDVKNELEYVLLKFNEISKLDFNNNSNVLKYFELLYSSLKENNIKQSRFIINKLKNLGKLKFFKIYINELKKDNLFDQQEIECVTMLFNSLLD